jgi:site-specific DNA-cytosine methylase
MEKQKPVAFTRCDNGRDALKDVTPTMRCGSNHSAHLAAAIPVNGMTLNKELRDKQMTGVGQEGDPLFSVRADGAQHAVGFYSNQGSLSQGNNENLSPTLKAAASTNHAAVAIPISTQNALGRGGGREDWPLGIHKDGDPAPTLSKSHCHAVGLHMAVRRLTPKECERLQGFPDNHTLIPWRGKPAEQCPDGPRYKALGNSMAVPCMAWIGSRIAAQESESLRYLSVCSGIEAASMAWEPLGWQPAAFAEVEKFPSAVLTHHWPQVPNMGDMNNHEQWDLPAIDVLVGGTPCQSFSVAGLRKGLRDPRGGLMLTFLEIAQRRRPRWVVWENVPGVLSSHGGRDFGAFLGALGALGYGWAYRVLDAQWFGVAQRRRRVFVIANLGDGAAPAKVLFESESVRRNPAPSRETGERTAATLVRGSKRSGGIGYDNQALFSQNGDNFVRPSDYPDVVGTLSDGAHQGGGLTAKMPTQAAYSPALANPLTARMGKGINTTLDEGQTAIVCGKEPTK